MQEIFVVSKKDEQSIASEGTSTLGLPGRRSIQNKSRGLDTYGFKPCKVHKTKAAIACTAIDRSKMTCKSVDEIIAGAKTGDLILVSGTAKSSKAIRLHTGSFYSHVAVIVKDIPDSVWQKYGQLKSGAPVDKEAGVFLFDSDYEPDGSVDGPTIRPLKTLLQAYIQEYGPNVDVVYRKLTAEALDVNAAWAYAVQISDAKYTAKSAMSPHFFTLYLATKGRNNIDEGKGKRIFCSQLAALFYRKMGILPKDQQGSGGKTCKEAGNMMPQDFASPNSETTQTDINEFLKGAQLDAEVRLDLSGLGGTTATQS